MVAGGRVEFAIGDGGSSRDPDYNRQSQPDDAQADHQCEADQQARHNGERAPPARRAVALPLLFDEPIAAIGAGADHAGAEESSRPPPRGRRRSAQGRRRCWTCRAAPAEPLDQTAPGRQERHGHQTQDGREALDDLNVSGHRVEAHLTAVDSRLDERYRRTRCGSQPPRGQGNRGQLLLATVSGPGELASLRTGVTGGRECSWEADVVVEFSRRSGNPAGRPNRHRFNCLHSSDHSRSDRLTLGYASGYRSHDLTGTLTFSVSC